jgi:hypothetical protein
LMVPVYGKPPELILSAAFSCRSFSGLCIRAAGR